MQKVYATVGKSFQQVGGSLPDGWIEMNSQRPFDNYIALESGEWGEPPIQVPEMISVFQAKAQLMDEGLYEQVDLAMKSTATDPKMRLAWATAQVFLRNSPTVIAMSEAFNWTSEYVDELFIKAAKQQA